MMTEQRGREKLFAEMQAAFLKKSIDKRKAQSDAVAFWKQIKDSKEFQVEYDNKMKALKTRQVSGSIDFLFHNMRKKKNTGKARRRDRR